MTPPHEPTLSRDALDPAGARPFDEVFRGFSILLAPTRFSATAPLKLAAPRYGPCGAST